MVGCTTCDKSDERKLIAGKVLSHIHRPKVSPHVFSPGISELCEPHTTQPQSCSTCTVQYSVGCSTPWYKILFQPDVQYILVAARTTKLNPSTVLNYSTGIVVQPFAVCGVSDVYSTVVPCR
jgi:hypothetical protein